MDEDQELVEVYMAAIIDAELIRSVLEGSGIPAQVRGSGASAAYPIGVGSLGETRVYVRAEDEDRAREVIADVTGAEVTGAPAEPGEIGPGLDIKWIVAAVVLVVLAIALFVDARGGF